MPHALTWQPAPDFPAGDTAVQILTSDGYELLAFDCAPPAGAATGRRSIGWELWHGPEPSTLIGTGDALTLRGAKSAAVAALLEHQARTAPAEPAPAEVHQP